MPDSDSGLDDTALILGELRGGFRAIQRDIKDAKSAMEQVHTRISDCRKEHQVKSESIEQSVGALRTETAVNRTKLGALMAGIAAIVSGAVSVAARLAARMVD